MYFTSLQNYLQHSTNGTHIRESVKSAWSEQCTFYQECDDGWKRKDQTTH